MISVRFGKSFINCLPKNYGAFWISHAYLTTSSEKSFEFLVHKYCFSPETVSESASVLTRFRNPGNCDPMLSFLKENGFSNNHLEKMVKVWPHCLAVDLENTVKPKIKIFQDLGFTPNDIAELISKYPRTLKRGEKSISLSLSTLKGLVGSETEVVKLVKSFRWYLTCDLRKEFVPNVEYLMKCGIPLEQINRYCYNTPLFLFKDPQDVRRCVQKADEMGVDRSSKMFLIAVRVISNIYNKWDMKLQAFRDMGFSEDNISKCFRQWPCTVAVSTEKVMETKNFLLATGKYGMEDIVYYPSSLCYSKEVRYKPRSQVLGILERKKLIKKWPSLSSLASMTNTAFFEKFVAPYLEEVGNIYMANISVDAKMKLKMWFLSRKFDTKKIDSGLLTSIEAFLASWVEKQEESPRAGLECTTSNNKEGIRNKLFKKR